MFRSTVFRRLAVLRRLAVIVALPAGLACTDTETVPEGAGSSAVASVPPAAGAPGVVMDNATSAPPTGNPNQDFLRRMIDHQKGLLAMAQPTKDKFGVSIDVRTYAGSLAEKTTAEVDSMTAMLKTGFNDSYLSRVSPPDQTIADSLGRQTGPAFDGMFYQQVIKHYQAGIALMDQFLPKIERTDLKAMAQRMRAEQAREVAALQGKR